MLKVMGSRVSWWIYGARVMQRLTAAAGRGMAVVFSVLKKV